MDFLPLRRVAFTYTLAVSRRPARQAPLGLSVPARICSWSLALRSGTRRESSPWGGTISPDSTRLYCWRVAIAYGLSAAAPSCIYIYSRSQSPPSQTSSAWLISPRPDLLVVACPALRYPSRKFPLGRDY